jgi:hypothetical protein
MAIAFDARVWCGARLMCRNVGINHCSIEVVGEVEDEMIDSQLLGYAPSVVDIADRAAPSVTLAAPEAHRHADNVVPLAP